MTEIFVTKDGTELTMAETVQQLMSRVTELEEQLNETNECYSVLLERICYLENGI